MRWSRPLSLFAANGYSTEHEFVSWLCDVYSHVIVNFLYGLTANGILRDEDKLPSIMGQGIFRRPTNNFAFVI